MTENTIPQNVHLVGSVPLEDSEAVFTTTAELLGGHIARIPDGETGARTNWVDWQFPKLEANPALEIVVNDVFEYTQIRMVGLREGYSADDLELGNLGYADVALESWQEFKALKQQGEIPAHCRFQVCLPTPLATAHVYVHPSLQEAYEQKNEIAMKTELDRILEGIPHEELAIQWDTAVEFALLEGVMPTYMDDPKAGISERLARLCSWVPEPVELGFHLCYGDSQHKHFCEPTDMSILVDVANGIANDCGRSLQWIHMPVPRDRSDVEFFRPLQGLDLRQETRLFLGLVHQTDGDEGASGRVAAARQCCDSFGVATECGFGRRPAETVAGLMQLHTRVAEGIT